MGKWEELRDGRVSIRVKNQEELRMACSYVDAMEPGRNCIFPSAYGMFFYPTSVGFNVGFNVEGFIFSSKGRLVSLSDFMKGRF